MSLYKFKSSATGDLIMLGPNGDEMLRALGREPAERGIFEPDAMPAAIAALERAVADDEARRAGAGGAAGDEAGEADDARGGPRGVTLRARLWPMVEMMKAALAARAPIVWGV